MKAIAKIQVLKRGAALDDASYRDLLERETGKRSSKGMSDAEHLKVISALEALPSVKDVSKVTGPFARKLQALWIAGYNLDVIHDKSDKAMISFLKRQTGLDHHRFLREGADATKAIDGLKLWIRRRTQNYELFTQHGQAPLMNDFRFQVCIHIWSELVKQDRAPGSTLTGWLLGRVEHEDMYKFSSNDWIFAMNTLGELYRSGRK